MDIIKKIEEHILILREIPVLLDSDVAVLYGVATKHVNQAVANNPEKFPPGYILTLEVDEWDALKSKFSTSPKGGGKTKIPKAFTEKGLYMLATILKSRQATQTTLSIIEAFSKLRELGRGLRQLHHIDDPAEKKSLIRRSGEMVTELLDDQMETSESETTIELNLALFKVKHTVKKDRKKNDTAR